MQNSIKGAQLGLLRQLLCCEPSLADKILDGLPGSERKDDDDDWSSHELGLWTARTLSACKRPVCIFLDGLDEISPSDGPIEVIDLVKELSGIANVKVYVSS